MEQNHHTSDDIGFGEFNIDLVLANGRALLLRPIRPQDRDGIASMFYRLTPASRHSRYLSAKPELTGRELAYLSDVDHVHHDAIIAIDQRDGSIVGVSRYVEDPDRAGVADIAVEVADELQNMRLGTVLAKLVVQRAHARGFTALTATTLWGNRRARSLLRGLGFRTRASHGSEIVMELTLGPARDDTAAEVANASTIAFRPVAESV